jgi:hypothetical protein
MSSQAPSITDDRWVLYGADNSSILFRLWETANRSKSRSITYNNIKMDKQELIEEFKKVIKALEEVKKNTILAKGVILNVFLDLPNGLVEDTDVEPFVKEITELIEKITILWTDN